MTVLDRIVKAQDLWWEWAERAAPFDIRRQVIIYKRLRTRWWSTEV